MNHQHAEALRLADDLDAMGRNKDMGRPAIQDIERRAAAMLRALAAPHAGAAPELPLVITSAPERIWLDLGGVRHLIDPDTRFSEIADVTWSEDNATDDGIEYVRADVAASPAAPAPCAMVGLTEDEQHKLIVGYFSENWAIDHASDLLDAAIRDFCQKNKLPEPRP